MIGFLIGSLCLAGLIATVYRRRLERRYGLSPRGCRGGYSYGGDYDGGEGRSWRRPDFSGFWFSRLRATPGQERQLREIGADLREKAWEAKKEAKKSKAGLADLFREEVLDETKLAEVIADMDAQLGRLKDSGMEAVIRAHSILEPEQRAQLADALASGRAGFGPGGFGGGFGRRGRF